LAKPTHIFGKLQAADDEALVAADGGVELSAELSPASVRTIRPRSAE
jgi:hypothetical protein